MVIGLITQAPIYIPDPRAQVYCTQGCSTKFCTFVRRERENLREPPLYLEIHSSVVQPMYSANFHSCYDTNT